MIRRFFLALALAMGAVAPALAQSISYACECDIATGASFLCSAGSGTTAGGTAASPRARLSDAALAGLAAGSTVRICQGGAWADWEIVLENANATRASPITIETYAPPTGATGKPVIGRTAGFGLRFGSSGNTSDDGGYVFRDFIMDGKGTTLWCVWVPGMTKDVSFENVDVRGCSIGHHLASGATTARYSIIGGQISNMAEHGVLGTAGEGLLIEKVTFGPGINPTGSGGSHSIYLGSSNYETRGAIVRLNTFTNSSNNAGVCTGGTITAHGRFDGLTIEKNTLTQDNAPGGGCYPISITRGYATAEWFRNLAIRGNKIVRCGSHCIAISGAVAPVIEDNELFNDAALGTVAIAAPVNAGGSESNGSDLDTGAIVRNNSIYLRNQTAGATALALRSTAGGTGTGKVVANNLVDIEGTGWKCFEGPGTGYAAFVANLCPHARSGGTYSDTYATLAAAQAAGLDAGGVNTAATFAATPSSGNGYSLALGAGSAGLGVGNASRASLKDALGLDRGASPDIGAHQRGASSSTLAPTSPHFLR